MKKNKKIFAAVLLFLFFTVNEIRSLERSQTTDYIMFGLIGVGITLVGGIIYKAFCKRRIAERPYPANIVQPESQQDSQIA